MTMNASVLTTDVDLPGQDAQVMVKTLNVPDPMEPCSRRSTCRHTVAIQAELSDAGHDADHVQDGQRAGYEVPVDDVQRARHDGIMFETFNAQFQAGGTPTRSTWDGSPIDFVRCGTRPAVFHALSGEGNEAQGRTRGSSLFWSQEGRGLFQAQQPPRSSFATACLVTLSSVARALSDRSRLPKKEYIHRRSHQVSDNSQCLSEREREMCTVR